MNLRAGDLARLQRLRERFLDDTRGEQALADYWRCDDDLRVYDAVLAARIGWKWDAALAECRARGLPRRDDAVVLDHGCGSGIASRAYVRAFGAKTVLCHDRSPRAMAFAARALPLACPGVTARACPDVRTQTPDVLLVSHVLGELDAAGERELEALARRAHTVVLVEAGSKAIARRLAALRDRLLDAFTVVAPCAHQGRCPTLGTGDDWCHFFAPPPPEVFTDGDWVRIGKALGIDLRSLPYAFVALQRTHSMTTTTNAPPPHRLLGRPEFHALHARVQVCDAHGLHHADVHKRRLAEVWKALKKAPETVRSLPLA